MNKGSEAQKQKPRELLLMLRFDEKSITNLLHATCDTIQNYSFQLRCRTLIDEISFGLSLYPSKNQSIIFIDPLIYIVHSQGGFSYI